LISPLEACLTEIRISENELKNPNNYKVQPKKPFYSSRYAVGKMTSEFARKESLYYDSFETIVQLPASIVTAKNLINLKIVILLYTEILQK
jgi:hypothetical protein